MWHDYCRTEIPQEPPTLTLAQWRRLRDHARGEQIDRLRRWLEQLYLPTKELTAISAVMTAIVGSNAQSPPGAKDVIVVTGPNVVGKSTLMMRWGRDRYDEWTRSAAHDAYGRPVVALSEDCEADLCPVAWINLPAGAKIKDVDVKILEFYGLPGVGVIRHLSERAVRAVARHRTRALIVDDAHLLKTDWKGGRDVLDHVKHLNTELGEIGATLLLVGADLEGGDLVSDPQIAGRLKLQTFPRYGTDDLDEMRSWQAIVRQVESQVLPHLPAGKPGMLFTQLAGELWFRTQGYLGDLTKLVAAATIGATKDGTHKILVRHLNDVVLSERAEQARRGSRSPARPRGR
jgi:GTPase SAR1 family protein